MTIHGLAISVRTMNNFVVSRLSSDTQLVQDGLSTSVAMTVKSGCICIAMLVVMFTYSWRLTIYAILLILPAILFNRIFMSYMMKYNVSY